MVSSPSHSPKVATNIWQDDDEDDEDDFDEEDVIYEPGMDGTFYFSWLKHDIWLIFVDDGSGLPDPPWGWDTDEELPVPRGHSHHHHSRRLNPWTMFPAGTERGMIGKPRDPSMSQVSDLI